MKDFKVEAWIENGTFRDDGKVECHPLDDIVNHVGDHTGFLTCIDPSDKALIKRVLGHIEDHLKAWRENNL